MTLENARFVYLAIILDGFSHKLVGWAWERTLATRLPKAALEQALAERQPPTMRVARAL